MPRRAKGARLYLDPDRKEWIIRDGTYFGRTGCPESKSEWAEKLLAQYIAKKYQPEPSSEPLIADVLLYYKRNRVPETRSSKNIEYTIASLEQWWGDKTAADIFTENCKTYARTKSGPAARRDLETLRAAANLWHKEKSKFNSMPVFWMPPKAEARERWLTRPEARRLRRAAMVYPHLYRFIVIGLLSGSRTAAILSLQWDWIDFEARTMRRRAPGTAEDPQKRTPAFRMGRALTRILTIWKRRDEALGIPWVIHYNGQPVKRLQRTWRAACKTAKLKGVSPHTMRHTRATWLMQRGVGEWEAGGHLGMSPETLRRVYGKHHPDFQKNAAEV